MLRPSVATTIRIPADIDDGIRRIVVEGGRYKSVAQFILTALRRLLTQEEGELARKKQLEKEQAMQTKLEFNP